MHQKTISSEMEGINFGEFSAECPEITRDSLCLCNLLRDFPDKYVVCLTSKLPEFCSAGGELPPSNLCCSTLCSVSCSMLHLHHCKGHWNKFWPEAFGIDRQSKLAPDIWRKLVKYITGYFKTFYSAPSLTLNFSESLQTTSSSDGKS